MKKSINQSNFINPLQVGDILYYSWGYEQTNVDFYQVIGKTEKSVKIQEIESKTVENGFMSGNTTALKDVFKNKEVMSKRVKEYCGQPFVSFDYGVGNKWDGRPMSCSWYA